MDPQPIRLTLLQPNLAPQRIDTAGPTVTLGRATECTVPIRDRYLSRRHAELVWASGQWLVRDCGSVNGTLLNGTKLTQPVPLKPGDRIVLGDTEVIFEPEEKPDSHSQLIAFDSTSQSRHIAIPLREAIAATARTGVLASLAIQFIEDRPMSELFDFILEKVAELLQPSRAALALLGPDRKTFQEVRLRRNGAGEESDLFISRTLLGEVIEGKNVVSYVDTAADEKLARAQSIIAQDIRSAICAPLVVEDTVLGVLYLDFRAHRGAVTHDDVTLVAQIARFAAVKLETTRLREESIAMAKLEEELRTAYTIQKRLLPVQLPDVPGYQLAGSNRPVRTVSGDYYDVAVRPDGRVYFIVADVSGKGITAALVMSAVATAFSIFTRTDPAPADLVRELNLTLAPKTAPTKFVTMVVAVLDPGTGRVEFANAGHVPPLVISSSGIEKMTSTDMVVGLFDFATYRNQSITLDKGDALVLFTDGVTEAENEAEDQLDLDPVADLLRSMHHTAAPVLLDAIEKIVNEFVGSAPANDDLTMFAISRD